MKIACFIPVKLFSERVKGKNFRLIGEVPLYQAIIQKCVHSGVFSEVFVDSDSEEIEDFSERIGASFINRHPDLSLNSANGNDLLCNHQERFSGFDYYFQAFATAPFLKISTLVECVNQLVQSGEQDSILTVLKHKGFFWHARQPISYRPSILPRSQDLEPVYEETTGFYGISNESLKRYRSRIGGKPIFFPVSKIEAVDLNTEEDFVYANWLVETGRAFMEV